MHNTLSSGIERLLAIVAEPPARQARFYDDPFGLERKDPVSWLYELVGGVAPRCDEFLKALRAFRHECQLNGNTSAGLNLVDALTDRSASTRQFFGPLDGRLLEVFYTWVGESFASEIQSQKAAHRVLKVGLDLHGHGAPKFIEQAFRTARLVDVMAEVAERGLSGFIAELPRMGIALDGQYVEWASVCQMYAELPTAAASFWLHEYTQACPEWATQDRLEMLAIASGKAPSKLQAVLAHAEAAGVDLSSSAKSSVLARAAGSLDMGAITYAVQALNPEPDEMAAMAQAIPPDAPGAVWRGIELLSSLQSLKFDPSFAPRRPGRGF